MVLGKLDIHMQRMKLDPYLTLLTKIKSKQIKDLNVKPETIELLKENISSKLLDIGLGDVLNMMPKAKINKWDYTRLKSFCTAKEAINKMRR